MSKDNIVKFPGVKANKHLAKRNQQEARIVDIEEYVQYMTDVIIEQIISDGYNVDDEALINDLTVTINMFCGALCRVDGIPHFTHDILDTMHAELGKLLEGGYDEGEDDEGEDE
jgi:hypothetical protein